MQIGIDVGATKIESVVLETDSPYLAPVPHRGKRNESGYLTHVNQKVAEIHNMTIGEIAKITTENAISAVSYTHLTLPTKRIV